MMELTDEALDYPDCMPPRANNSIKLPPEMEARFAKIRVMMPAERVEFAKRGASEHCAAPIEKGPAK